MIINQFAYLWETKSIDEPSLRALLTIELFAAEPGRKYWELYGNNWWPTDANKRMHRFMEIAHESYREVTRPETPTTHERASGGNRRTATESRDVAIAMATCAILIGGAIYRKISRASR
ncbi:hypothetical protein GCM10029978_070200 [Actinoallomurus acanthiterrae]